MEKKKFLAMLLAFLTLLTTFSPATYAVEACEHENLGKLEIMKAATCTKNGIAKRVCADCGETLYEAIMAHHTAPADGGNVTKKPTCVDTGEKSYTCTICHVDVTEEIPATGEHTYVFDIKDETCTENAKVGSICSVCKKEDPNDPPSEVPGSALGHDEIETIATPAGCETTGAAVITCSRCDYTSSKTIEKLGHIEGEEQEIEATCVSNAAMVVKCNRCETILKSDDLGQLGDEYLAKGHDWNTAYASDGEGSHSRACNNCDDVTTEACALTAGETIPATCHTYAATTYACEKCDYSKVVTGGSFDESTHDYEEETVRAATCTKNGIARLTCKGCNASGGYGVIPAAHKVEGAVAVVSNAACEVSGAGTALCAVCKNRVEVIIPALEHKIVTAASVKEGGTCEDECDVIRICELCKKEFGKTGETIPAPGHKFELKIEPATCTKGEVVKEVCEICGGVNDNPGPQEIQGTQLEHQYQVISTPAACGTAGKIVTTCALCDLKEEKELPAKAHVPETNATELPATCEHDAQMVKYCTVCHQVAEVVEQSLKEAYENVNQSIPGSYSDEEIAAVTKLEHNYDGAKVVSDAAAETHQVFCNLCSKASVESCDYEVTTEAATCETVEKEISTCKVCGRVKTTVGNQKDPDNHKWINFTVREATCDKKGIERQQCEYCNIIKDGSYKTIEVQHTWDEEHVIPVSAPACGVPGAEQVTCLKCGTTQNRPVKGLEHDPQWVTSEAATCTKEGLKIQVCNRCSAEIAGKTETIAKTPHNYKETFVDPTCTEPEKIGQLCTACKQPKKNAQGQDELISVPGSELGHDYQVVTNEAATCTADGVKIEACSRCKEEKETEIKAEGHKYGDSTYMEPDCENNGREVKICDICGYEDPDSLVDLYETNKDTNPDLAAEEKAIGHEWGDAVSNHDGTHTKTCKRDNCGKEDSILCAADPDDASATIVSPATCQTPKTTTAKCKDCGFVNVTTEGAVDATNHDWKSEVLRQPTCTKNGLGKWVCACGTTDTSTTETGGPYHTIKAEHKFDEQNVTVITPAACEVSGVSVKTCTVCGVTMEVETQALMHDVITKAAVAATCTKEGVEIDYCARCQKQIGEGRTIAITNHQFVETIVDETCTENMKVGPICSICGIDQKNDDGSSKVFEASGSALGHDWSLVSEQAATCTQAGVKYFACQREDCHEATSEAVEALDHVKGQNAELDPDCENNARNVVYCSVCGEICETEDLYEISVALGSPDEDLKALGHQWTYESDNESDHAKSCSACGKNETEAHNFGAGVRTDATCQVKASTTYTCEGCGYKKIVEDENGDYDPTNHDYKEKVVRGATCTKNGIGKWECACGDVKEYFVIDAAGAHDWSETNVITGPSCSTVGSGTRTCSICNTTETVEIDKIAHTFGEDYANEEGNAILKKCEVCGAIEIVWSMPDFELCQDGVHADQYIVSVEAVDATCEQDGRTAGTICGNCGESISGAQVIKATGHQWDEGDIDIDEMGKPVYVYTCLVCGAKQTADVTE